MPEKKYSKERLEKSRFWFLEQAVENGISSGIKTLEEGNFTEFLNTVAGIDSIVEHHKMTKCVKAENEEVRIDCISKVDNVKIRSLNRLSEMLVEKCGGYMHYIEETEE